jgi:hypothetical protein
VFLVLNVQVTNFFFSRERHPVQGRCHAIEEELGVQTDPKNEHGERQ